jgi:hypothetical protein
MKAYWGSGGIAPLHSFFDLGTRWRWVISFTPQPLYPQGKSPSTHWIGGWVGPRVVLEAVVKRKIPSPAPLLESNPRTPIVQPVAQSLYRLSYHRSQTIPGGRFKGHCAFLFERNPVRILVKLSSTFSDVRGVPQSLNTIPWNCLVILLSRLLPHPYLRFLIIICIPFDVM